MRLLHVIQPPRGGAVMAMLLLVREQLRRHDVGVVCHPSGPAADEARKLGADVWTLPVGREISLRADLSHLLRLSEIVFEYQPDLLHAHSSKAGVIGRVAAKAAGVPVVLSPHNFAYRAYEGSALARYLFLGVERALAPWSTCVHVVSRDEYEDAVNRGMTTTSRCGLIPNGIDADRLLALEPQPWGTAPCIGTFARLFSQKRIDIFIEAVASLAARGRSFRTLVIGEGPLRSTLERQARDLGNLVEFDPRPHDATSALRRIDIYALTSSHEASPLTLMEAMAAAKPVVATDVGGVPQIVTNEKNGLLVPFGNGGALTDAFDRLLADPTFARELGTNARLKAGRRFRAEMMSNRMEVLYETALRAG